MLILGHLGGAHHITDDPIQTHRLEEATQRRVAAELERLILDSFAEWKQEEARREQLSRNAMGVADNFSSMLRSHSKRCAAEAAAQEMECVLMQAEDAYVECQYAPRVFQARALWCAVRCGVLCI